jgi:hypothetical protein
VTRGGPSLETRRALVTTAYTQTAVGNPQGATFLVLGGNLPFSGWGAALPSDRMMAYLAAHPWIWSLTADDLLAIRPRGGADPPLLPAPSPMIPFNSQGVPVPSARSINEIQNILIEALMGSQAGPINNLGWNAYLALFAPTTTEDPALAALRAGHLGQVGYLVAGARWASGPNPVNDCSTDPDLDGEAECILASEQIFALFEPSGARLVVALGHLQGQAFQWIAPSSQFFIGLSDPGEWEPDQGPAGDPLAIPGGFSDSRFTWSPYSVRSQTNGLVFTSPDGTIQKTFTLTSGGLRARYLFSDGDPITVSLPLAVNPNTRFTPDWGDRYKMFSNDPDWTWGLLPEPRVRVRTDGQVTARTMVDSRPQLSFPENPNQNFPPGHFLPFPLAVLEIRGDGPFTIDIEIDPLNRTP